MIKTIFPSSIKGLIKANPSKSAMQRAVAAALLAKGKSIIYNPGLSNDCLAAMDVAARAGANILRFDDRLEIISEGINPVADEINCGESGLGIRMFTPILALSEKELIINGNGSLTSRPMDFFEEILPQLQVSCTTQNGKLPIQIKGPLQPKNISVDGSLSSQFLTGLLMAFGAAATEAIITVRNLKSKQYIELTLQIMNQFGLQVENKNFEKFIFKTSQQYHATNYTVEGDWSGAAFILVAGAIAGSVQVQHLLPQSAQPDKAILNALKDCGATIIWTGKNDLIVALNQLNGFEFDATDCPDLFPPLVALAANCIGITKIKGVSRLKHKESDRGVTLQEEFGKMNIKIILNGDMMEVYGGEIKTAKVFSHHDHRIAMACAVAALKANGKVEIESAEAVNKSYPEFWDHLKMIGVEVENIFEEEKK